MKKIILTVAAVFAFGFANAQDKKESSEGFSKGDVFVTGAFSLGSTNNKNNDEKTSSFEIAPQVNYFVTENISVGLKVGFASDKADVNGVDTQDDSSVSFGLAGRYYFTPASKFSLFGELGAEYVSTTDNLSTPEFKVNGFGAGLGLGMNYFVSSNFSIEAGVAVLNFASAKADVTGAKNVTAFSFGGDWRAVSFGVNYKF
ncbi:outer membrane beta-barrel protein [Flavobacterium sp.]|jgi:outer membrane protein|uniref:outer membrane beta-barrel protein n=1 Tax=Flavobacterium sp. TaxID=239 RepID=UPI0037C1B3B1